MADRSQSYRKYERVKLTPQQEHEMLLRYGQTHDSIASIGARFGVHDTYPYRILAKWNVDWRRDSGTTFEEWVYAHNRSDILTSVAAAPPPPTGAISHDMQSLVQHPAVADVRPPATGNAVVRRTVTPPQPATPQLPNVTWLVDIPAQTIMVYAPDIEDALTRARTTTHLRIAGIRSTAEPAVPAHDFRVDG